MKVMVNGLPGNVSTEVAKYLAQQDDIQLRPYSLTGPNNTQTSTSIGDVVFSLITPDRREANLDVIASADIAIDYTHPSAVHDNVDFYCQNGFPFVMGTTGGDRERLNQQVRDSNTVAVIAPNMAPRVVAMQAMIAYGAQEFPGLFEGYKLKVDETHQKGKADTSGTAKANVASFNAMGVSFENEDITKERRPNVQLAMGVPPEHLGGHGWHRYQLDSPKDDEHYEFIHNINGRQTYANGTALATRFLKQKIDAGEKGKVYSMIDVLRGV